MILQAEVLYNDELADKLGRDEQLIWETGQIDLRSVTSISPYMKDNEPLPEHTEVFFGNNQYRIINVPYEAMVLIMSKIWGQAKTWEEFLK
ncbi:hypothetical protein AHMF7605_11860 [Adhaeribacter arboris]|uniref:Uncharacterized protein n=1 Tax=Adhaeribacter arboris TaxID=2072846 RepID=A0A2T2YF81_9BACT|nr:hypothetical protein [Adhaeribacter arboris]PSR54167.1 hypothetical protein AHMF7605_11860 [Adhaeribacter arboris]